jgi:hypothetical protein
MRYLVVLEGDQISNPPPQLMGGIMALGDEATKAGALLDTGGLAPSSEGALVELAGGKITVTDGPFAEAKEMISYAIYQVRTKEEAVEWSNRFLKLHRDHVDGWQGSARILRVFGPEDFAPQA